MSELSEDPGTARLKPSLRARAADGWRAWRELGPLGLLFAVIVVLPFGGDAVLATTSDTWVPWFTTDGDSARFAGWLAMLLFVAAATLLCGLSFLHTYAVGIAAGYLYGTWWGLGLTLLGICLAAFLGRAVMAWLAGDRLMHYIESKPKLLAVHHALLGDHASSVVTIVTLVRLAPVTPFAGTNLVMAAAKVTPWPFVAGTVLGLGPRSVLFVLGGAGLAELEFGAQDSTVSLWVSGVSLLVSVVGLWVVAKRQLRSIVGGGREAT